MLSTVLPISTFCITATITVNHRPMHHKKNAAIKDITTEKPKRKFNFVWSIQ